MTTEGMALMGSALVSAIGFLLGVSRDLMGKAVRAAARKLEGEARR